MPCVPDSDWVAPSSSSKSPSSTPRRAQRERGMAEARDRHEAHAVKRPAAPLLRIADIKGEILMDKLFGHFEIEAAGAAQTHHVPGVEQLDLALRHEAQIRQRRLGRVGDGTG